MRIFGNFSALLGLIGFIFPFIGKEKAVFTTMQYLSIAFAILFLIGLIIYEFTSSPKKYKSALAINDYMFNWIKKSGRTLIFTRDMSWASGNRIQKLLKDKANSRELILCMPVKSQFALELETLGAEIVEYSKLKYRPKSRFTMIHYGRTDTKMAIGRTASDGAHYIQEIQNGVATEYNLAEDLFEVLKEIKYNG